MPVIKLNGIDTFYQVDGEGPRAFMVFNGAGCTTRTWDELMPEIVKLGRVVRFDARGLGKSGPSDTPYSLKDLAEDGSVLLDYLEISTPIILAHAFGGRVAQVFTRDHPERVRALILCGTGGLYPPLPLPAAPVSSTDIYARVEMWLTTYFGREFRARHPGRAERIINDFISQTQKARTAVPGIRQAQMQMEPAENYWGKVPDSTPTLLVYGTEDKFGHEKNARDLAQRIKRSKLVFIEGAAHMAIQEEPERVGAEITAFVKENNL